MSTKNEIDPLKNEDNQPVYRQVAYALEDMILNDLEMGDYLPSENELSIRFGVNRHTVRRAVDDLVSAGFVARHQGKRSQVINNQIQYPLKAGRFTASLDKLRLQSKSQLLKTTIVASTPKISDYLGLDTGSPVIVIDTLRFVDDQPISSITHFLNPHFVEGIEKTYHGGSLHHCIEENYALRLQRTTALISAVMPTHQDAIDLKVSLTQPLLRIKSFNAVAGDNKKIVEVSISKNRSDRFQIKVD